MAALLLAALLLVAAGFDLGTRRIPNALTLSAIFAGIIWHGVTGGGPGLMVSLEGVGVASLTLALWLARALGAGDVKLLGAVGAWMGPSFLLWAMLGMVFAGGLLALAMIVVRGALHQKAYGPSRQMPLAPAIALGAAFAFLHLRLAW